MLFTDSKRLLISSLTCFILANIQGCYSTTPMSLNSIQYQANDLSKVLIIDDENLGQSPVGHAQLNMRIRNISKDTISFELSTSWYDKRFVETESLTGWQRVTLTHNQSYVYKSTATQNNSTHYVVNIRGI